jgi:hypothetical protein
MKSAPVWSAEELEIHRLQAIQSFRRERLEEPLEAYLDYFQIYQERIEDLLEATVDLSTFPETAGEVLTNPRLLEVVRYLPGPPISTADLQVLTEATSLTSKRFQADPELLRRVVEVISVGLDRRRFPWVTEGREPDEAERLAAIVATAALMRTQRLSTARKNEGKKMQERKVEDALLHSGFQKVASRTVSTAYDLPELGQFCGESMLGNRKADFIVRLWDNRALAVECKVSNSATNSVKRLNNDAAAKAEEWKKDFGERQVVPTAVLSGVYKLRNLENAQRRGLTLFWAHELDAMLEWIESTRASS